MSSFNFYDNFTIKKDVKPVTKEIQYVHIEPDYYINHQIKIWRVNETSSTTFEKMICIYFFNSRDFA